MYCIPVCTWLTYNSYDYSAGYVFGIMKQITIYQLYCDGGILNSNSK